MTGHFKREPRETYKNENCNNQAVKLQGNWHMERRNTKHNTELKKGQRTAKLGRMKTCKASTRTREAQTTKLIQALASSELCRFQANSRSPEQRTAGTPAVRCGLRLLTTSREHELRSQVMLIPVRTNIRSLQEKTTKSRVHDVSSAMFGIQSNI